MLLERAGSLVIIAEKLANVDDAGQLVLVSGEAGVGKTALVEAFCRDYAPGSRVLLGHCDDLFAPRPLGPLTDIAHACGGPLQDALQAGDGPGAFDAFLEELSLPPRPVIAVIEDIHWADEATFDLIRFVARRLRRLRCLVILTYRDDLDRDHPLRVALGDLVESNVTRIQIQALSLDAVQAMAGSSAVDPAALHSATGGNPFFVAEVLAGGGHTLPSTVRDAVLGRAQSLSSSARDALDAAAILRDGSDAHLVSAVAGTAAAAVDECVAGGFLDDATGELRFRHDLTRLAIENAIPPVRRRRLHAQALESLGDDGDLTRRAHHALAADDANAVLHLAPLAAAQSTVLGAHREAAALLGGAVKYADLLPPDERAALFEARARACERIDDKDEAISVGREVLVYRRSVGDPTQLAVWLTWLGGVGMSAGTVEARNNVIEAITLLTPQGESADLARALAALARQHMMLFESEDAIDVGRRALDMAERLGQDEIAIHAEDTVGSAMTDLGDDAGFDILRQNLARCLAAGLDEDAARACFNLAGGLNLQYLPRLAAPYIEQGIAIATAADLPSALAGLLAQKADTAFLEGHWDQAVEQAQDVLQHVGPLNVGRLWVLATVAWVRVRRGDPDPLAPLEEMLAMAETIGFDPEPTIHLVKVEAAWLTSDPARAAVEFSEALETSSWLSSSLYRGQVALWSRRLDVAAPITPLGEPFLLHLAGRYREAAAVWHERGCPYEEADALGDSSDEADLRRSLEILQRLGARPRAAQVTRRLREIGVRTLPRGPRATTQASPAGLTTRELQVLALLCEHLSNSEIADRLVVSPKTVDHHVSAVLSKLSVSNRREAVAAAIALGLSPQNGEGPTTT